MKDAFKLISWLTLVVGWLTVIVWALVFEPIGAALGLGLLAVCAWTAWALFLDWLFGVRRRIKRHLGVAVQNATFLDKEIGVSRATDMRRTLETLYADKGDPNTGRFGVELPANGALASLQSANREIQPLKWTTFETIPGRYDSLPTNAIYLLHHNEEPFVAYLVSSEHHAGGDEGETIATGKGARLQVFARSLEAAVAGIEYLVRVASVGSVLRGRMLHLAPREPGYGGHAIRILPRPEIDQERIILPPEVLEVVRRTIDARRFHHVLERHGHASKTGLLLHGAPGVGKTLVAKHLIGACPNHTAIVPEGMDSGTIREAFRLAAYLQPALIVIEDVDLLAERRETNANTTGLQELMNELDGLAPATEAIVLMTTNRPEVLEPALASRPGRVSQAIQFPLPDAPLRERLLEMFCATADVSRVTWSTWVARTEGASPAFLEELTKKALLSAAERCEDFSRDGTTMRLADDDFDRAMHELVVFGGSLTGKILGFAQPASEPAGVAADR